MALPKLQRTGSLKASYATLLSYGPAGAGKTRSIRTIKDQDFNPFVIVTELGETGGMLSLQAADIPFVQVDSHQMILEVVKELTKKPGKIEYEQQQFGCLVLDSLTQWGEYPLERFMQIKGWTDLHDASGNKDPRAAYGYLAEKGRQLYKVLFDVPAHLYIIAREGLFGGGDEPLFAAPELPGQKLAREVPGWPDATVRLRVINGKHMMVTQGEGGSPARVRYSEDFPKLPGRCNPDIGALMRFVCGDREAYKALVPESATKPALQGGAKA